MNADGQLVSQTLDYMASMLTQLQSMASAQGYPMLAHLIEMARLEANDNIAALTGGNDTMDGSAGDGDESTRMTG
ncbi:hypothetical protein BZU93_29185 [Salmonella enterica subsp. enterica]|nr:hypothetical protein [Salmonella enterica subsp. enterica serovar Enteritidis]